mmetsp:Transcript_27840/g.45309  ORF Transcript_27840/g.45309 Transcript_27840/m.45309 type:complete len:233 (-) Transcript_27840:173-871(-)
MTNKAFKCGKDKQYAILVKRDEGMNQSRPNPSVSDEKDAYGRHVVSLANDTDFFIEVRNEHKERWCDVVIEMGGKYIGMWRISNSDKINVRHPVSNKRKFAFQAPVKHEYTHESNVGKKSPKRARSDIEDSAENVLKFTFYPEWYEPNFNPRKIPANVKIHAPTDRHCAYSVKNRKKDVPERLTRGLFKSNVVSKQILEKEDHGMMVDCDKSVSLRVVLKAFHPPQRKLEPL